MKKFFFFSFFCLMALALNAQEFVDLGLPSGTKWKDNNESDLYNYNAAFSEFGNNLPTFAQFEELKDNCKWEWKDKGYQVTGPNGNSIFLPATSKMRDCNGEWFYSDGMSSGSYWTATTKGVKDAWGFSFTRNGKDLAEGERCFWRTIRLVQNK